MAAVLIGTEPFADLARLETSTAGLDRLRLVVFGPVLGDVPEDAVRRRAVDMAGEVLTLLSPHPPNSLQ